MAALFVLFLFSIFDTFTARTPESCMFLKTKAIVLHSVRFSDRALIVHLYTEERGRMSCVAYGSRGKKTGLRAALLQPLSVIDMEAEIVPGRELPLIREMRPACMTAFLSAHPVKNAVSLFLAEFLYRTLREMQTDRILFRFLEDSVSVLNDCDKGMANFHLVMLLQMTRYLGFYPNMESGGGQDGYFDMINGVFCAGMPAHKHYLTPEASRTFRQLMRVDYRTMHLFVFSRVERMDVLELILNYYRIHLAEFGELKSLPVLTELFD
jgi:DNA repair protein RecO (recombination protein O)